MGQDAEPPRKQTTLKNRSKKSTQAATFDRQARVINTYIEAVWKQVTFIWVSAWNSKSTFCLLSVLPDTAVSDLDPAVSSLTLHCAGLCEHNCTSGCSGCSGCLQYLGITGDKWENVCILLAFMGAYFLLVSEGHC